MQTVKCPISKSCNRKYLRRPIKLHIINTAKHECKVAMMNLLNISKNKPYEFSPAVMLRTMPHVAFIRRNTTIKNVFEYEKL